MPDGHRPGHHIACEWNIQANTHGADGIHRRFIGQIKGNAVPTLRRANAFFRDIVITWLVIAIPCIALRHIILRIDRDIFLLPANAAWLKSRQAGTTAIKRPLFLIFINATPQKSQNGVFVIVFVGQKARVDIPYLTIVFLAVASSLQLT